MTPSSPCKLMFNTVCGLCWLPLVSGLIQEVAQWIFKGQPLNTLEKHAPICEWEEEKDKSNAKFLFPCTTPVTTADF